MNILVTGANGYIGVRLIPLLIDLGHHVYATVRDPRRFFLPEQYKSQCEVLEVDFLQEDGLAALPKDVDAAYYLIHSLAQGTKALVELEEKCIRNFLDYAEEIQLEQLIYLSGLTHDEGLTEHLSSRQNVERCIQESSVPYTILRAGVIVGSGSASFEIIRDLVEKLPVMIAPKWVARTCQPIAIYDVLQYLEKVLGNTQCLDHSFDIGGPEVLTYKEMLLTFAQCRGLWRGIFVVPVLTPRLSSYWLHFITSVPFSLAQKLVHSMINHAVCSESQITHILPFPLLTYRQAVERAFQKIEQDAVTSSWKDAVSVSSLADDIRHYGHVPTRGCYSQSASAPLLNLDREAVLRTIWKSGGKNGWHALDWAWTIRGWIDSLLGGVGLRRGRTHPSRLIPGDALDFWRVIVADKDKGHLLLYAEMKVPGEAWLEFAVDTSLTVKATFRPKGLLGRLYWICLIPIHLFIFHLMVRNILSRSKPFHPSDLPS